jgi:hypothetical protein
LQFHPDGSVTELDENGNVVTDAKVKGWNWRDHRKALDRLMNFDERLTGGCNLGPPPPEPTDDELLEEFLRKGKV